MPRKAHIPTDPTQRPPEMMPPPIAAGASIMADPEYTECLAMYCSGWAAYEIEEKTGIRADRIRQWVHRDGWAELKAKTENHHAKKHPVEKSPVMRAVANSRKGEIRKKFIENTGEMALEDSAHWKDMGPEERLVVASNISSLNGVHRKNLGLDEDGESDGKHISLTFLNNASNPGFVKLLSNEDVKEIEDEKSFEGAGKKKVYTMEDF